MLVPATENAAEKLWLMHPTAGTPSIGDSLKPGETVMVRCCGCGFKGFGNVKWTNDKLRGDSQREGTPEQKSVSSIDLGGSDSTKLLKGNRLDTFLISRVPVRSFGAGGR